MRKTTSDPTTSQGNRDQWLLGVIRYYFNRSGFVPGRGWLKENKKPALIIAEDISLRHTASAQQVIPGSPAEKSDLRIDDILVTVDGKPVTDCDRFRLGISQRAPGTFVLLEVWRNGRMKKVRVALADLEVYERRGG